MKIGYARVSTGEQNLDLQLAALKAAGCEKIFSDKGTPATAKKRPEFDQAVLGLQAGDVFVIWKFDRAFRSLIHALNFLEKLDGQGVGFASLTEKIDTSTAHGRLVFQISNAMAEFERGLISERTKAGIAASAAQGQKMGRPPALNKMQIEYVLDRREKGEAVTAIARSLRIHRSTLYGYLKEQYDRH